MSVVDQIMNESLNKKLTVTGGDAGQCTAVPHREQQILGLPIVYGNAKDTFANAPASLYDKDVNTPTYVPREGAIGVSKLGDWGHTWVVRKNSDANSQNVLEQNNPIGQPVRANTNKYAGVYGYFTPKILSVPQITTTPTDVPTKADEGVVNGQGLRGHIKPEMGSDWPWWFNDNEHVTIVARIVSGEEVKTGPYQPSKIWYLVHGNDEAAKNAGYPNVWVSDAYLHTKATPAAVPDWTPTPATPDPTPVNQYSARPAQGLFGFDASSVGQGKINWDVLVHGDGTEATQGAGIDFALLRAGHVGKSHGGDDNSKDPQFDFNRAEAVRLGIPFGSYWFCYPSLDPIAEAQAFANVVAAAEDSESLWADVETESVSGDMDLIEWVKKFKAEVERLTKKKLRGYYNVSFNTKYPALKEIFGADGVWAAKFDEDAGNGRPFPEAIIDQYTDKGKLPGIAGTVDLNVAYMTKAEFIALGRATTIVTPQPPVPTGTPGTDNTWKERMDAQDALLQKILAAVEWLVSSVKKIFNLS